MNLKARKISDKTVPVEFDGAAQGLVVTVRYVTPEHRRDLFKRATKHGNTDWDKFFRLLCDAMVVDTKGLTLPVLESLVDMADDSERPPVREDGTIEVTPDIAWFLWQNAPSARFQDILTRSSDAILEEIALEKKRAGDISAG
jgi:hypothetical protein